MENDHSGGGDPVPVRVYQCDGPRWTEPSYVTSLDEVEAMDLAGQREVAFVRQDLGSSARRAD
jgi:hypothetical protein